MRRYRPFSTSRAAAAAALRSRGLLLITCAYANTHLAVCKVEDRKQVRNQGHGDLGANQNNVTRMYAVDTAVPVPRGCNTLLGPSLLLPLLLCSHLAVLLRRQLQCLHQGHQEGTGQTVDHLLPYCLREEGAWDKGHKGALLGGQQLQRLAGWGVGTGCVASSSKGRWF